MCYAPAQQGNGLRSGTQISPQRILRRNHDMTAVNQQSEQQIEAGTYVVDPIHSSANFAVKHMVVATFRGRFENFDATLEVDESGDAKLTGTVDANSIVVKDENLAGHLKSPDFFDTERYPELKFESTAIRRD